MFNCLIAGVWLALGVYTFTTGESSVIEQGVAQFMAAFALFMSKD